MAQKIDYTNLTYDQMVEKIRSQLAADPKYANIRESGVFTTLVEIFLNATDVSNFYIQNQANECFLDTARLYSSVIVLARMLGYAPARPEPASSCVSIEIVGPLSSDLVAGDILYFNRKSPFVYNGVPFILKNTYKYTFTESDITNGVDNPDFTKTINYALISDSENFDLITSAASTVPESSVADIEIIQGEILSHTILGMDTDLIGQKFQKYTIPDTSISNLYGSNDLGYDPETGESNFAENLTRVAISNTDVFAEEEAGTLPNYDAFYDVNRKTLLNVDSANSTSTSAVPIIWMRSSLTKEVEIVFGDDIFAKLGLTDVAQNIYIQYFSTLGNSANRLGVVGQELQAGSSFSVGSIDFSNNLIFKFRKNITGGADFENIDSIKINAPANYATFDRCVTKQDYRAFLKSLTSPIVVKNAIAWGEQEEIGTGYTPIEKMFNVVLFTCLASLYDLSGDVYFAKEEYSSVVLDDEYSPYELMPSSYFNIMIRESVPNQLNFVNDLPSSSGIVKVTNKLNTRSQITVKNVYITPHIQKFKLTGNVYTKKLSNINFISKEVNNSIYSYLDKDADFGNSIYLSKLVEIIESNPNVVYSDIQLVPVSASGAMFDYDSTDYPPTSAITDSDIEDWIPVGGETLDAIKTIFYNDINTYMYSRSSYTFSEVVNVFTGNNVKDISKYYVTDINERNFYNELCKTLYDDLKALAGEGITDPFCDSENFQNIVVKLHNSLSLPILESMLDDNGNIVNFSMDSEIPQVDIELVYLYK